MSELFQSIENAGRDQGRRRRSQDRSFEVEVTCELDSDPLHGPGGHVTLHFAADGTLVPDSQSAQLEALPVGAGCAAVETVQGGATEWGTNPPATTVESDGATLAVTLLNPAPVFRHSWERSFPPTGGTSPSVVPASRKSSRPSLSKSPHATEVP